MNDKKLVQRLLPLVSDDILWARLSDYLENSREKLIKNLINSQDIKQINRTQGQVQFIDEILTLPNSVRNSIQ